MQLKKLAQCTMLVTNNSGGTLLIDPGRYNLDPGRLTADTVPTAQTIVITHRHTDHFDMSIIKSLLRRSSPTILTNKGIQETLRSENIEARILEPGMKVESSGFSLTAIQADHRVNGEVIPNFGLVVSADESSFYYTSDTLYINPSSLPRETHTKYLFLPISGRGVTMDANDALKFAKEIKAEVTIPVHLDSPKDKDIDPQEFVGKVEKEGLKARTLKFGEEIVL